MADDTNANPTTEATTEASGETGEKTFSQADLDAAVAAAAKSAKDAAFAEARKVFKPKRDEAKPAKEANSDKGEDREARREAQSDAVADAVLDYGLTKEQRNTLRDDLRRADPEDPDAWVKSRMSLYRGQAKADETKSNSQSKETAVAQKSPGEHPGPPQSPAPWERPSDPFKWTEEQVAQLTAQKGPREANRIIRRKAEEFARTMRIQLPSPNRR